MDKQPTVNCGELHSFLFLQIPTHRLKAAEAFLIHETAHITNVNTMKWPTIYSYLHNCIVGSTKMGMFQCLEMYVKFFIAEIVNKCFMWECQKIIASHEAKAGHCKICDPSIRK